MNRRRLMGAASGREIVFYDKLICDGVAYTFVDDPIISSDNDVTPQEKHDLIFECCPVNGNGYPFGTQIYQNGTLWGSYRTGFYRRNGTILCGPLVGNNAYGNALNWIAGHRYKIVYHCDEAALGGYVYCEDLDTGQTKQWSNVKIMPNGIFGIGIVMDYERTTGVGTPLESTRAASGAIFWGMKMIRRSDNALVKDIRPCLYNGEAGVYDVINKKFFGNLADSGSFSVAND